MYSDTIETDHFFVQVTILARTQQYSERGFVRWLDANDLYEGMFARADQRFVLDSSRDQRSGGYEDPYA